MILTRFNVNRLIRWSAFLSILLGLLYLPSNYALSIVGLGPELEGEQQLTRIWAMYAIFGGTAILISSFLIYIFHSTTYKRVILIIYFLSMCLLIIAQLLPLFWWIYIGMFTFTWSNIIAVMLHFILLILASWTAIVAIHAMERP